MHGNYTKLAVTGLMRFNEAEVVTPIILIPSRVLGLITDNNATTDEIIFKWYCQVWESN